MATSPPARPLARPAAPDGFASTEWSLVLAASAEGGPALDRLCGAYWRPVYVYIRATGVDRTEAEDATQEFFADMLRRDWLHRVDRERGSFRAFLRSSVHLFLNNRRRHALAQRRGGGEVLVPLDTDEGERELSRHSAANTDPAAIYEQTWANCVIEAALARLEIEQSKAGKREQFERFRPFLTCAPADGDYEKISGELQVSSGRVALLVHRLSRRFAEVIRAEVAATLANQHEVEAELRHLLRLVSGEH